MSNEARVDWDAADEDTRAAAVLLGRWYAELLEREEAPATRAGAT